MPDFDKVQIQINNYLLVFILIEKIQTSSHVMSRIFFTYFLNHYHMFFWSRWTDKFVALMIDSWFER